MLNKRVVAQGFLSVLTLFGGTFSAAIVQAADASGPWLVRARAVYMDTANKSDSVPALGVLQNDTIHVESKMMPELDISYFFTKNIAAELVLTVPQKHDVSLNAGGPSVALGSFKHLPPTLSLQYHFMPEANIRPYVGVGLNYTRIMSTNLSAGGTPLQLEKDSVGPAFGAGVDVKIAKNTFLNLDVKKVLIRSDVFAGGQRVSEVKVDPVLIGVGVGFRF